MIRKQFYITAEQDQAIRQLARQQGVSASEVVRRALEAALAQFPLPLHGRREAIERLLENCRQLGAQHQLPAGFRFDRAACYQEREARQLFD
ncbi:CopG-like domain-containing protein DNA-binding domain [Rhodothermus marinus SG0.5JP17-172]|jgi:hypothetical protein|uniref:ribbon-helix-helix domain-containing protein n=1 Tax=Rhodothermus marinus TaxID=29549 RepID=UPI000223DDFC|nr:CopG family transcriptional regulator [Rhodothermus marinus]AEN74394.1 CopG-like domain-containing protein DNA-binding domain [Rhodothermus marinus SG0.5JP17-172]MBO2492668.1 ribbon-helix-helix protein, CopG family [Rhodothermus marinus]